MTAASAANIGQKPVPTLAEVDAFAAPELLVKRLVKHHGHEEGLARKLLKEAKRMLYLHRLTGKNCCPSAKVDDAWHEMLMFTRFYRDFCRLLGKYVHHVPTDPDCETEESRMISGKGPYAETLRLYREHLHDEPDGECWPKPRA